MLINQEEHEMAPAKKLGKATLKRRLSARSNRCVGTTAGDDAQLLDLCREFGALEQRILIATLSIDSEKVRIPENSPRHSKIYSPTIPTFIRPGIPRFTRPGSGLCG